MLTHSQSVLQVVGIYLFTNGFLLTRLVLDHKSDCAIPPIALSNSYEPGSGVTGCWHPKTFNKAIVVLVDALRYDFTVPSDHTPSSETRHYHNKIPVLWETSITSPANAFLRPFIADPPTTTLQRLKGLTTGTLPTFIDVGSSFSGTAIEEDNLISQLQAAGKNIVHLGDDTWQSLFPGQFDANLTKPFDSFNAWDLHTVDNGVSEHLFPLLEPSNYIKWDVLIAHYLGVDHAGHRYGPDHPAMGAKLQQMDDIVRRVMQTLEDDTLLIVMGDHGMDSKGDHGGESEDEIEAALWMYSKRDIFGRTSQAYVTPPITAKERPVNQIDLVPTLALLLGLPIPFNNLGAPIEEAFIGTLGDDFRNLADVNRLTAAQINQYQREYALVRKSESSLKAQPSQLWTNALKAWDASGPSSTRQPVEHWQSLAQLFIKYQEENLDICKSLWARFDLLSMAMGIIITMLSLIIPLCYAHGLQGDTSQLNPTLLARGLMGLVGGAVFGMILALVTPTLGLVRMSLCFAALACSLALLFTIWSAMDYVTNVLPRTFWGWACIVSVLLLSIGFASNSYTIWEDEILLFLLASFGVLMLAQSLRLRSARDRSSGILHSIIFIICVRLASLSRLCRDEQMPYCKPTFYASATSSTSAPWQLAISYVIALVLPSIIKTYYQQTQSYRGSAPFWIGVVFRITLLLIAIFWTLDAADDGEWLDVNDGTLKTIRVYIAQVVLVISAGAGTATFAWQGPNIGVNSFIPRRKTPSKPSTATKSQSDATAAASMAEPEAPKPQIVIQGTSNLYGSHFAMLPFTVLLTPLLLLQKPMGQAVLALTTISILSLLELLHLLRKLASPTTPTDPTSTLGPTILALLGQFAYFKTGHQAVLSSIQWTAAYVPLHTLRYPWAPIFVVLNTFAGPILCAAVVPCLVFWRRPYKFSAKSATIDHSTIFAPPTAPRNGSKATNAMTEGEAAAPGLDRREVERRGILTDLAKAHLTHMVVYSTINLATTVFAGHLRRHLMLYRVFCPRWMLGSAVLVMVELVSCLVGVGGARWSVQALTRVFGW